MKRYNSVLLVFLFGVLFSQKIDSTFLKSNLTFLASDALKGRNVLTNENTIATEFLVNEFQKLGLKPCIGNDFKVGFEYKNQTIYNVCAKKEGEIDETLLLSAHFDHVGVSKKEQEDMIFNGADDNASGVSTFLAIAKAFQKTKTKKTIWFVGFNAEEVGLLGSKAFVSHAKVDNVLKNIVAVFNFEMLGTVSAFGKGKVFMTGDQRSNLDELINQHGQDSNFVQADPYKEFQLFYRSDNAPFAKKGVVAHSFSTVDLSASKHYHQVNDDVKIIAWDNYYSVTQKLSNAILEFANKDIQPKYNEKHEEQRGP